MAALSAIAIFGSIAMWMTFSPIWVRALRTGASARKRGHLRSSHHSSPILGGNFVHAFYSAAFKRTCGGDGHGYRFKVPCVQVARCHALPIIQQANGRCHSCSCRLDSFSSHSLVFRADAGAPLTYLASAATGAHGGAQRLCLSAVQAAEGPPWTIKITRRDAVDFKAPGYNRPQIVAWVRFPEASSADETIVEAKRAIDDALIVIA